MTSSSPRHRRHEVEIYAHALRARLQLASFKALNGLGKSSISDLDTPTSSSISLASPVKPLHTSLAENKEPEPEPAFGLGITSTTTTPALSQSESLPSSSQSSVRSTRSIYFDIFGTDFRSTPSSSAPSSGKSFSRATSFATSSSTPSKPRKRQASSSASASTSTSTKSLLDKAASSPQLGSPERKNGRFDWHNNPTPAMVAHETQLAEESFALPTGSPSKRRREASNNPASSGLLGQPSTPRRSRMQSSGFLPNGHPASSLAQDLGLTAPRTPRSRHASGRHVFAVQHQSTAAEQDQAERDRVANTLAALAEARNADKSASSSDSSSGSDRPHTPPPPSSQAGFGLGFASPSIRRSSAFAHPGTFTPARAAKKHRRNVSWSILPTDLHDDSKPDTNESTAQDNGEDDRAAADYLLFLASSPSPSSIKRFSSDADSVSSNGILSTPAQTSLWDPFKDEGLPSSHSNSGGRRSRIQSSAGPRHINSSGTPLTPPPSARKLPKSAMQMVGLGFDAETMSSSTTPVGSPHKPAANAEEYMLMRTPRSPRTPPPSTHLSSRNNSATFDGGFFPTTPPNAPGAPGGDTTFHYADFVNVSPSPQPPSTGRFPGGSASYLGMAHRTPTKTNRFRFDPRQA